MEVNQDLCTGCGACVDVCAADAVIVQNGKAQIDKNNCIECGVCTSECPEEAISMG